MNHVSIPFPHLSDFMCVYFREVKVAEVKPKELQLSVERVPGTLSTASKSVQVNGAATVSIDFFSSFFFLSSVTSVPLNALPPPSDISITDKTG